MRVVNLRDGVFYPMARIAGFDPDVHIPIGEAKALFDLITSRMRFAWDYYDWAEFERTEERAFRQIWQSTTDYPAGQEVYYEPAAGYYRVVADTSAGETPESHPAKFTNISATLDRYFGYDQVGKQSIGELVEIAVADTRTNRSVTRLGFRPSNYGIDVPFAAGYNTLWLTYKVRQPEFNYRLYDPSYDYARGEVAYDPDTGECYRAREAGAGQAITDAFKWHKQEMPYVLAEYVKTGSERALHDEIDKQMRQGDRAYWNAPRRLEAAAGDIPVTLCPVPV